MSDFNSESTERWISRRQASHLLELSPTRMSRYLKGLDVKTRQVPYGPDRQTTQFWLADLKRISNFQPTK